MSLAFGGPIGLARDLITDTLVGEPLAQGSDVLKNEVTAVVRDTSYDTVSGYTSNSTKQQLSGLTDPASQTALQVSEQLQRTKDGVGFLASVVLGAGGIAKTAKIDGNEVEVSTAGIGSRGELTKPYDPVQTRNDLEVVHGSENVKSMTVPPYNAKNVKLAGQRHPVTGVVFDNKGYPVFDDIARYDTNLINKGYSNLSYTKQMELASKDLWNAIQRGEVNSSQFSSSQLRQIQSGSSKIDDYTWHHHQDNGRMQLVPEWEHSKTGHIGGDAMQGGK